MNIENNWGDFMEKRRRRMNSFMGMIILVILVGAAFAYQVLVVDVKNEKNDKEIIDNEEAPIVKEDKEEFLDCSFVNEGLTTINEMKFINDVPVELKYYREKDITNDLIDKTMEEKENFKSELNSGNQSFFDDNFSVYPEVYYSYNIDENQIYSYGYNFNYSVLNEGEISSIESILENSLVSQGKTIVETKQEYETKIFNQFSVNPICNIRQ